MDAVFAVQYCYAGGIVAAIFEAFQPFQEDWGYVTLSYRTDDSAHNL